MWLSLRLITAICDFSFGTSIFLTGSYWFEKTTKTKTLNDDQANELKLS